MTAAKPKRKTKKKEQTYSIELPQLIDKEQQYVDAIFEGKTQHEAYQIAWGRPHHENKTHYWRVNTRERVKRWLAQARQELLLKGTHTHEQHLDKLEEIRDAALSSNQFQAATFAEVHRGKSLGYYTDHVNVVHSVDPISVLNRIAALDSGLARRLAEQHRVDMTAIEGLGDSVIDVESEEIPSDDSK